MLFNGTPSGRLRNPMLTIASTKLWLECSRSGLFGELSRSTRARVVE